MRYLAVLFLMLAAPATAQTIGSGLATTGQFTVGSASVARGQSFISPGGTLTSFAYRTTFTDGGNATFYIAPISGSVVGTPVYSTSFAFQNPTGVYQFSGLNVATTGGQSYVAIFSPFGVSGATVDTTLGVTAGTAYPDGALYTFSASSSPEGQTGSELAGIDIGFQATFVPEPASWGMMLGGLAVAGGAIRRRRKLAHA